MPRLARRVWRRVHPDLFARWPEAQAANQRAMQELQALLDAAEAHQLGAAEDKGALPHQPRALPPSSKEIRFFVHSDVAERDGPALREVSTVWSAPPSPSLVAAATARSTAALARVWKRSAEGCMVRLLRSIDPTDASLSTDGLTDDRREDSSPRALSPPGTRRPAAAAEAVVSAAKEAAMRRRQHPHGSSRASEASSAAARRSMPAATGGRLRPDLLFFYGVHGEEAQERARARVASLLFEMWPADEAHSPILVYSSRAAGGEGAPAAPYVKAAEAGFACVPLEQLDAPTLHRSLALAAATLGGSEASVRRTEGDAVLRAGERLRSLLGCETVHTASELCNAAARSM